jgi:putative Mg2+ transporter-C (MgtC) family protein
MNPVSNLDVVLRIALAVALGAAIGGEREVSDQPAGLRTHITVALGACLFGLVSVHGFDELLADRNSNNYSIDPTRIASQVVVGIGFLGAGVIFRQGTTVKNLTTAASLWVTAAIGLAAGVGRPFMAVVTAVAVLGALVALRVPRDWLRTHLAKDARRVEIVLREGRDPADVVGVLHAMPDLQVHELSVQKRDGCFVVTAEMSGSPGRTVAERVTPLAHRDDVRDLDVR